MRTRSLKMNKRLSGAGGAESGGMVPQRAKRRNGSAALLIHDDGRAGSLFARVLISEGFDPHLSENALDAFETWSADPPPDMLFADIRVPGAWTVACHVGRVTPRSRVILLLDRKQRPLCFRRKPKPFTCIRWTFSGRHFPASPLF